MSTLLFLLMLVGLILPVRSLFRIVKLKYPVPSVKESFGAMEITLLGIGIILGVLLLVFVFRIWSLKIFSHYTFGFVDKTDLQSPAVRDTSFIGLKSNSRPDSSRLLGTFVDLKVPAT
jgi:hypothetical protein